MDGDRASQDTDLGIESLEDGRAWGSVDVDGAQLEQIAERGKPRRDDSQELLESVAIWVYVDDGHSGSVVREVDPIRHRPALASSHVLEEQSHRRLELGCLAGPDI